MTGTFMRIGVPCSLNATSFEYECPEGWRIVHVRRLSCGWFTIILEKVGPAQTPAPGG